MKNEILIRPVSINDLHPCAELEAASYTTDAASKEQIRKRIETYPEGFLVAELNNTIIGLINSGATHKNDIADEALKDMSGHAAEGKHLVIFSLAVDPAYRKQGISRLLMKAFIKRARQMEKQSILLICKEELISYYERFDFQYIHPSASTHGGFTWHEMAYTIPNGFA